MLTSITSITNLNDSLKQNLAEVRKRKYDQTQLFGSENEYTLKGMFAGLSTFTVDIGFLTKNPTYFIRVSTYAERNNIISYLTNINFYLENNQFNYLPDLIDNLKGLINHYNLRTKKEHFADFHKEIDNLKRKAFDLDEQLLLTKQAKETAENQLEEITQSNEIFKAKLDEYENNISTQTKKLKELEETIETGKETLDDIENLKDSADELLKTIQTNETIFKGFVDRIINRESELEKQSAKTKDYEKSLSDYTNERKKILQEAKDLINSAKAALQYKTAEGMSAAFQTKESAASSWKLTLAWLIGAVALLLCAVGIGVWQLYTQDHNLYQIIGRISMISLLIVGATFCAQQYTKQKNLIEDYAYKSVLSKSFIGFAEEIKKHDDQEAYNQFLALALKEILQDPLRARDDKKHNKLPLNAKSIEDITNLMSALAKFKTE